MERLSFRASRARSFMRVVAIVTASACGFGSLDLEGKLCDERGACALGYVCEATTQRCLKRLADGRVVLADGAVVPEVEVATDGGNSNIDSSGAPPLPTGPWTVEASGVTVGLRAVSVRFSEAHATGAGGTLVRREFGKWKPIASGTTTDLNGVVMDAVETCGAGNGGLIFCRSNGASGSGASIDTIAPQNINAFIRAGATYVVAGDQGLLRAGFRPDALSQLPKFPLDQDWRAIAAQRDDLVFAVSAQGAAVRWTPTSFSNRSKNRNDFTSVATNGTETWATAGRSVLRFDGDDWIETQISDKNLNGIWLAMNGVAYAVGDGGVIFGRSGATWTRLESGTTENLRAVSGHTDLVVAVGDNGTIVTGSN